MKILLIIVFLILVVGFGYAGYLTLDKLEECENKEKDIKKENLTYTSTSFSQKVTLTEEERKNKENKIKAEKKKLERRITVTFILAVISFIGFVLVPFSVHQINTGEVAVVKVWGKAKETKTPGTHFNFWLGKTYITYDTKVREIDSRTMAYSQDAQTMEIELNIQYRIQIDKVLNIYEEYGQIEMLESRIKSVCDEKVKTVMSSKQAMRIIETRNTLSSDVIAVVSEATGKYYIEIVNVVITNIDFSDAFEQAVENKMIAEQQQLQEEYNKQKAITQAEAELEVAKRQAQAKIEQARAEAESIELKAEAEAQALEILQETWNNIPEEIRQIILQEKAITTWNGKLPETLVGDDFLKQLLGILGE